MSFIRHDYRCDPCGLRENDQFVRRSEMHDQPCRVCGKPMRILPCLTKLDWDALAKGDNASPEAIRHFEKKRRQQRQHEEKNMKEHGDRGKAPGA